MKEDLIYLAGIIDADGCFSLPLNLRKTKIGNNWVNITPMVRVGMAGYAHRFIESIPLLIGTGKIYWSNKGRENEVVYWQTTNWTDSLITAEKVYPYLRIKKNICKNFIEACKLFLDMKRKGNRKTRDINVFLKIAEISCSLNSRTRQTKRYRNVKNYEYWEKEINKIYKQNI